LTHGLKAPGFNHRTYQMKKRLQNLISKCHLYRYNTAGNQSASAAAAAAAAIAATVSFSESAAASPAKEARRFSPPPRPRSSR
jgi:hypothetical protein